MVSQNFLQNSFFMGSYPSYEDLPTDTGSEIAFCGRSNCGKSSVLNAITNNKKLAKTSKTPGRTQSINVFKIDIDKNYKIIDLPGYGYAKVSKSMRADWGISIDNYFSGSKRNHIENKRVKYIKSDCSKIHEKLSIYKK